ncbi:MAG: DnaA/Hda family protein [Pseudomonadota bacterium]
MADDAQYFFDLPAGERYAPDRFVRGDANSDPLDHVLAWPEWPNPVLCIVGPKVSGKTHLARIWAARAEAVFIAGPDLTDARAHGVGDGKPVVIDDADCCPDADGLFHLFNHVVYGGGSLLLTATRAPAAWAIDRDDLRTRMNTVFTQTIGPPDDALLAGIIVKRVQDEGLTIPQDVVSYMTQRIDRSYAAQNAVIDALVGEAQSDFKPITKLLARKYIAEPAERSEPGGPGGSGGKGGPDEPSGPEKPD